MTKRWKNCAVLSFYGDGRLMETEHCEVSIGDGRIAVTYEYAPKQFQTYEGSEIGQGHFNLRAKTGGGKATLHQFPDGIILDGWWAEDGNQGMWRITLDRKAP